MSFLLEVCADSLESVRAAIRGGCDRIELCSALAVGGLTPYKALLEQIRCESDIPVRCLMRPRGGDFLYTSDEIKMMAAQIKELKKSGANGFVIGCLNPAGELDGSAMERLIDAAAGAGLTLHRCIDVSREPESTYVCAHKLGIDTVLTSGAAANCIAGKETIGKLLELRDNLNGPEILIGAGVNSDVITQFRTQFPASRSFHMSGKKDVESKMEFRRSGVPMGLPGLDEWHIQQTDEIAVSKARSALYGI